MSRFFEELDYQPTAIGPISLRRRRELRLNVDVLEIMLGDEHLMSDLFTTSEIALAKYGLDAVDKDGQLSVVVGGLGMGFTAASALEDDRIDTLLVVEKLSAVLDWHKKGLIPLGESLTQNPNWKDDQRSTSTARITWFKRRLILGILWVRDNRQVTCWQFYQFLWSMRRVCIKE